MGCTNSNQINENEKNVNFIPSFQEEKPPNIQITSTNKNKEKEKEIKKKVLSISRFPAIKLQPSVTNNTNDSHSNHSSNSNSNISNNNNNNPSTNETTPQLIIGRIGGIVSELKSPHNNEVCAFYRLDIQIQSSNNLWEQKYTEIKCSDFYLVNPEFPKEKLYVCGKEYVVEIISRAAEMYSEGFHNLTNISDQMQVILQKNGISTNSKIRFREIKSDVNSQLAVFGVVETGHPVYGSTIKKLVPATELSVTQEYRTANNWTNEDVQLWSEFYSSGPSRLVLGDTPECFQGIIIDSLTISSTSSISLNIDSNAPTQLNSSIPSPTPELHEIYQNTSSSSNSSNSKTKSKSPQTQSIESNNTSNNNKNNNNNNTNNNSNSKLGSSSPVSTDIAPPSSPHVILVQIPLGATPGSSVRVPGPDGNSMMINVPPNASPGDVVEVIVK